MGIDTEFGKAAERAFNTPPLSELVSQIDLDEVLRSGTSISRDRLQAALSQIRQGLQAAEEEIRSGGGNWEIRAQLAKGIRPLITTEGGRGVRNIVEQLAMVAGYQGQLHQDMQTPQSLLVMINSDPMNPGTRQVTLFQPLPGARVFGKGGEVWQAAAFLGVGENRVFGLAYLRINKD